MSINVDRGYQLGEQWNPTDLFPQHYIYLYINLVFLAYASGCSTCLPPKPIPNTNPISNPTMPTRPRNALKLGDCTKILKVAIGTVIKNPPDTPFCSLLQGLVDTAL